MNPLTNGYGTNRSRASSRINNPNSMTKKEVDNLKKLSKITLISNVHKFRVQELEQAMGRRQFLSHFQLSEAEYLNFLNPQQELSQLDHDVIEKNIKGDVFNFSRRNRNLQRSSQFQPQALSLTNNRQRVSHSGLRGRSTTLMKNELSAPRIGRQVFTSRRKDRPSSVSSGVTPTPMERDHTQTPDYQRKGTLTNNFGRYKTPKKGKVSTKGSRFIPNLRLDYSNIVRPQDMLNMKNYNVNTPRSRVSERDTSVPRRHTFANALQRSSRNMQGSVKKPIISYGADICKGKGFDWAPLRRDRTSLYNDFDVENMADYEYSYERHNSPTKNTFLRNRYNGGKGGVVEDIKVEDHTSPTIYYALPKTFYELEDKPRIQGSRLYSPDYKESKLARAIESFGNRRDTSRPRRLNRLGGALERTRQGFMSTRDIPGSNRGMVNRLNYQSGRDRVGGECSKFSNFNFR